LSAWAFDEGWKAQKALEAAMTEHGRRALAEIEADPERVGIVLFGRPYNAFSQGANKGIPHKFASRGYTVIPVDFLDLREVAPHERMYWSMGQMILKGAKVVKHHPQLFGVYITNFSCGPDSFIVGFFRNILGRKPSLTLELDNHTADAGLETRIEAFLDIIARCRGINPGPAEVLPDRVAQAHMEGGRYTITTSSGETVQLDDPCVKLVFPSMSSWSTRGIAAACRRVGVSAEALPPMTEEELKLGKGNTLCKECLPMQLTTGALLKYLERRPKGEITVYFMPTTEGPCRFGQYREFMKNLVQKRQVRDLVFMSLSSDDSYGGMGTRFVMLCWYSVVVSDCFHDIHNLMLANAVDPQAATTKLDELFEQVLAGMESGGWAGLRRALKHTASALRRIPMKRALSDVPTILLVGEIYVRAEGIARRWLPEYFAEHGIATHMAPLHEWVHYTHYGFDRRINDLESSVTDRMKNRLKWKVMQKAERDVVRILAASGWHVPRVVDVEHVVEAGQHYVSPNLFGEAILTVGGPMAEVGSRFCGAIAIGPFGCMPNRLSESILTLSLDREHIMRLRKDGKTDRVTSKIDPMPFLSIETDGGPFPQVIEARLETFMLQAMRLHEVMQEPAPTGRKLPKAAMY
jgi:predicted nucleotide-binding protein (sugar kinase/HSP70/actin superfamily)